MLVSQQYIAWSDWMVVQVDLAIYWWQWLIPLGFSRVRVKDYVDFLNVPFLYVFQSVQHENSYRDPRAKYCYGEDPPDLQLVVT